LKSKVTQKLVNACRLTLQCPAAGKNKGVNGSQAGGKLSFYCLWRVLNFRWHCTLTHEANCLTARGAVYVCTRVLLMEIGQIIKCGSSLDPQPLCLPHHTFFGELLNRKSGCLRSLLAALLVFAFSLAFCVGPAKLLLLFQLLRQHKNFRVVYKLILVMHRKKFL